MLFAVALANRMARVAWALMAKGGIYRDPAVAAAWGNDRRVDVEGGSRAKGHVRANGHETGSGKPAL